MLDSIKQKLEQINLIDSTEFKKAGVLIILMREEGQDDYKFCSPKDPQIFQHTLEKSVFLEVNGKKVIPICIRQH